MEPVLILILSCQANRASRQEAIRLTWARHALPSQIMFFVEGGHSSSRVEGDRILLDAADGYDDLAEKAYRMYRYCHDNLSFNGIVKCDDDSYLECGRIAGALEGFSDYTGHPADDQPQFSPYAQGGCYWISRKGVEALVNIEFQACRDAPWYKGNNRMRRRGEQSYRHSAGIEDVMVGDLLQKAGIHLQEDRRFNPFLRPTLWQDHSLFSNHYVSPGWMYRLERFRHWPATPLRSFMMGLLTRLPSARTPR